MTPVRLKKKKINHVSVYMNAGELFITDNNYHILLCRQTQRKNETNHGKTVQRLKQSLETYLIPTLSACIIK